MTESTNIPAKVHVTGTRCPNCHHGKLAAVMNRSDDEKNDRTFLDRLRCTSCLASFEAVDRGMNLEQHLATQLKNFRNPANPPRACAKCGGKRLVQTTFATSSEHANGPLPMFSLHCAICLALVWREPSEDVPDPQLALDFSSPRKQR